MSVTSSRRINVTLSTLSIEDPADARIAAILRSAQSTCSPTSPIVPVSRLRPAWPEVKTNEPWRVA